MLLESLTGKQGWCQWKQRGAIRFYSRAQNWQHSGVHWTFLSTPPPRHDPLIITTKINLSIQQKTDKGQSKYYHKSNNIGPSELCNQSFWWEENNGLCSVCKTMKTAVTICNISDHRVTTKPTGYKNMCYHCSNNQKLNG